MQVFVSAEALMPELVTVYGFEGLDGILWVLGYTKDHKWLKFIGGIGWFNSIVLVIVDKPKSSDLRKFSLLW